MRREQLSVYFIMGTENTTRPFLAVLEEALANGVTMFQFREKGSKALTGTKYEQLAKDCQALCRKYNVPFIVNDDVDLAIRMGADGVHIGQDDEAVATVKQRIGSMLLGVSAHTLAEVQEAIMYGADYVGVGPIFETQSKEDAKKPAGTIFLQQVRDVYPDLAIVAIGGITEHNAHQPLAVGADGVAVISTICESTHMAATIHQLKNGLSH